MQKNKDGKYKYPSIYLRYRIDIKILKNVIS